jgi:type IV pilus assembly protein PilQ
LPRVDPVPCQAWGMAASWRLRSSIAGALVLAAALAEAQAPPTPPPPTVPPPSVVPVPAPSPVPVATAPADIPAAKPADAPAKPELPATRPVAASDREPLAVERFREERDGVVSVFFQVGRDNAKLLLPLLQKFMTPKGEMLENEPLRLLMIRDVKENIDRVVSVLRLLDAPDPQILIEATIVEVTNDFNLQIGVEGLSQTPLPAATPLRPIPETAVYTRSPDSTSFFRELSGRFQPSEYVRSLQTGATPYQGASIGFGSVNNFMTFSGIVRLLSDKGYAKILSRPRIMVKSGKPAEIFAGEKTPYLKASLVGNPPIISGNYDWLETGITLKITPRMVSQDIVEVDLKPSVKTVIGNVAIQNGGMTSFIPAYLERRADTVVAVPDGAEIVIGGLQRFEKSTDETGIPLLMDIPLLGYLFKRHEEKEVTTNIIIVVRPTVIRDVRTLSGLVPTDLMMPELALPNK